MKKRLMAMVCTAIMALSMLAGTAMADADSTDGVQASPEFYEQADLGVLEGKKATCFPGFEEELKGAEVTGEKVVVDGNIITAKGAGCALDFGFTIVSRVQSKEDADRIASSMQC